MQRRFSGDSGWGVALAWIGISAVSVAALAIAALIGRITPNPAWAQQQARSALPQVLSTILDAHWNFLAARAELPQVQGEQRDHLEVQDFVQYAFEGGALRLFVAPPPGGGGDIFAVLVDTRLSAYANFGMLSSESRFVVAHTGPYVLIVPIRPVAPTVFAKLKSRRWTAEELQREIGAPSYHWHVHGVGWKGMTYVPEGMSFVGDTTWRDERYRFQLVTPVDAEPQEPGLLPPLSSVARINYPAMQASTRSRCSQRILEQRVQTDEALRTGERSPDGRFVVGVVNFSGLRYTDEFVIKDNGKPERRLGAGEGVVDKFWLNATSVIFAIWAPTGVYTFSALDPVTGEIKQLVNVDCSFPSLCISERGISGPHAFWYTTGDGEVHDVQVRE